MNLEHLLQALKSADVVLNVEDVLDALWLATRSRTLSLYESVEAVPQTQSPVPPQEDIVPDPAPEVTPAEDRTAPPTAQRSPVMEATAPVYAPGKVNTGEPALKASPVALPAGHALTGRLPLSRALRPFRQRWPSQHQRELDEERTAEMTAELHGQLHVVFRPVQERWFDVDVVLEDDPAIGVWRDTMKEFEQMLRDTGAFRDVRSWRLRMPATSVASTKSALGPLLETQSGSRRPAYALGGTGVRRLTFFATHGASERWLDGSYLRVLAPWLRTCSVVLLHLLDRRNWKRVALGEPQGMCYTQDPGAVTSTLRVEQFWWALADEEQNTVRIPVAPLTPAGLGQWSHMQMARGGRCAAILLDPKATSLPKNSTASAQDYERDVSLLREASPDAFRLAVYLCSGPFTMPVARLVQEAKFGAAAEQQHLAEVLLSGLVFVRSPQEPNADPNEVYYEFHAGARTVLIRSLRNADAHLIATALERHVSQYIEQIYGRTVTFRALVADEKGKYDLPQGLQAFAQLGLPLLGRAGQGKTPAQLLEDFRTSQPPDVISRVGHLASTVPIGGQLESQSIDPVLWNVLIRAGLLMQDTSGAWTFLPGIEPLLKRLPLTDLLRGVTMLWMNDPGDGNEHDIDRLRNLGGAVDLATDTEEAVYAIWKKSYDLAIVNLVGSLGRNLDRFGNPPVIFYGGLAPPTQLQKILQHGAFACANTFEDLFEVILEVTGRTLSPPLPPRQREIREVLRAMGIHRTVATNALSAPRDLAEEILGPHDPSQAAYQRHLEVVQTIAKSGVNQIIRIEEGRLLVVAAVIDHHKHNSQYEEAAWTGLIGRAAREGQVVWAPDVSSVPNYISAEPDTRSELVLPLRSSSAPGTIGVVNIEMDRIDSLTEFDIQWLQEFCAPLAPRLLQQVRHETGLHEKGPASAAAVAVGRNDYAIVVGVNENFAVGSAEYGDFEHQANLMYEWLLNPDGGNLSKENAWLFVSRKATLDSYAAILGSLAGGRRLYLYLAGHAFANEKQSRPISPMLQPYAAHYGEPELRLSWIAKAIGSLQSRGKALFSEIVILMEGVTPSPSDPMENGSVPAQISGKPSAIFYVRSKSSQKDKLTRLFLKGLQGAAALPTGEITAFSLGKYLVKNKARHYLISGRNFVFIPARATVFVLMRVQPSVGIVRIVDSTCGDTIAEKMLAEGSCKFHLVLGQYRALHLQSGSASDFKVERVPDYIEIFLPERETLPG